MSASTTTAGEALERDHRAIDERFAQFGAALDAGRVDAGPYHAGAHGLRRHIWIEEELHFPPLRAVGLVGPILVMLREHGQIWDLLDILDERVAAGAEPEQVRDAFGPLARLLEDHNVKEERILYPSGDAWLTGDVVEGIRGALDSAQTPDGWSCEMAGIG